MAKKADAWKEYEEAALVDMMLKVKHDAYVFFGIMIMVGLYHIYYMMVKEAEKHPKKTHHFYLDIW